MGGRGDWPADRRRDCQYRTAVGGWPDEVRGRTQRAPGAREFRSGGRSGAGPVLVHGDRSSRSPPSVIRHLECAQRTSASAGAYTRGDVLRLVDFFFAPLPPCALLASTAPLAPFALFAPFALTGAARI